MSNGFRSLGLDAVEGEELPFRVMQVDPQH